MLNYQNFLEMKKYQMYNLPLLFIPKQNEILLQELYNAQLPLKVIENTRYYTFNT